MTSTQPPLDTTQERRARFLLPAAGALAGIALAAAGLLVALSSAPAPAPASPLRTLPGITLYEDGSVSVDRSSALQDARADLWVCSSLGNGACGPAGGHSAPGSTAPAQTGPAPVPVPLPLPASSEPSQLGLFHTLLTVN